MRETQGVNIEPPVIQTFNRSSGILSRLSLNEKQISSLTGETNAMVMSENPMFGVL